MRFIKDIKDCNIENLKCIICNNYLTAMPIRINIENGRNACGRCDTNSISFIHNSWFPVLAKQFIFPCMNEKQGCLVNSCFEDMCVHEKTCMYQTMKCHCSWTGHPFQLKSHYELEHTNLITHENETVILQENFTSFLFKCKSLCFYINNCKFNANNKLQVDVIGLSAAFHECNATFVCKVLDSGLEFNMKPNQLTEIPFVDKPLKLNLRCEITKEMTDSLLQKIICCNCSIQMTPPILQCSRGHSVCIICALSLIDYCEVCQLENGFICDTELDVIAILSTFLCKWDCGGVYDVNHIRQHEWDCEKRLYECFCVPNCEWKGYLSDLPMHEKQCSKLDLSECNPAIINKTEVVFLDAYINYECYNLITYNYYFDVSLSHEDDTTKFCVCINDTYALGRFRFEVDLLHREDPNSLLNKTYRFEDASGECRVHFASIPKEDILKFGHDNPLMIIVRFILLNESERKIKTDKIYTEFFKSYRRLL